MSIKRSKFKPELTSGLLLTEISLLSLELRGC